MGGNILSNAHELPLRLVARLRLSVADADADARRAQAQPGGIGRCSQSVPRRQRVALAGLLLLFACELVVYESGRGWSWGRDVSRQQRQPPNNELTLRSTFGSSNRPDAAARRKHCTNCVKVLLQQSAARVDRERGLRLRTNADIWWVSKLSWLQFLITRTSVSCWNWRLHCGNSFIALHLRPPLRTNAVLISFAVPFAPLTASRSVTRMIAVCRGVDGMWTKWGVALRRFLGEAAQPLQF